MTMEQVRQMAERKALKHGLNEWARNHHVARSHLSEFINGKRLPTSDILEALNLEWRIVRKVSVR